jgi:hypothetical protein
MHNCRQMLTNDPQILMAIPYGTYTTSIYGFISGGRRLPTEWHRHSDYLDSSKTQQFPLNLR